MGDILNSSFGRATSIARRSNILPEETATPQGSIDLARGKTKPKSKSLFGKPITEFGRTNKRTF